MGRPYSTSCETGHWFTYYGSSRSERGTAPVCQRPGCKAVNPVYYPEDDQFAPRYWCHEEGGQCTMRGCPLTSDPDFTGTECPLPRLKAPPHFHRPKDTP